MAVPLISLDVVPGRAATLEDSRVSRITGCTMRAWCSFWSLPDSGILMVGISTLPYYLSLFKVWFGVILREKHCNQFEYVYPDPSGKAWELGTYFQHSCPIWLPVKHLISFYVSSIYNVEEWRLNYNPDSKRLVKASLCSIDGKGMWGVGWGLDSKCYTSEKPRCLLLYATNQLIT